MRYKIWNWAIFVVMIVSAVVSTIAAYSHEWDKASYFALLMLIGKFSLDENMEI
jgi:hypothetical protein